MPLSHPASNYRELSCFLGDYCLWLASSDDTTWLSWYNRNKNQSSRIDYLDLDPSSIVRYWHRDTQPIPSKKQPGLCLPLYALECLDNQTLTCTSVPEAAPRFDGIAANSTSIRVCWSKPDVVGYLLKRAKKLEIVLDRIWDRIDKNLNEKYIQCEHRLIHPP